MSPAMLVNSQTITFRPFLPWLLMKNFVLLCFGVSLAFVAASSSITYWWGSLIVVLAIAVYQALGYANQAATLDGLYITFRKGYWSAHETSLVVWHHSLQIQQDWIGRLFDYATIYYEHNGQVYKVEMVASIRAFRYLLAERRNLSTRLLAQERGYHLSESL